MSDKLTPKEAIAAVKDYRKRGWRAFPLPAGQKKPDREKGWQKAVETVTDDNLEQQWANGENVGVILDPPIVDIDLDCQEAVDVASYFLPETPFKFGRLNNYTHWVYEAQEAESDTFIDAIERQKRRDGDDAAKDMIVEVRHQNGYSMFPPSVHPDGHQLKFAPNPGWPEAIIFKDLYRRVEVLAATALMVRYWPGPGARNEATLALCGGLVRAEREDRIDARAVDQVVKAIVECGGNSDPVSDFKAVERTRATFSKIDAGNDKKKVKGWASLEKILGANGQYIIKQFREWLRIAPKARKKAASPLLGVDFADKIVWDLDKNGNRIPAKIAKNVTTILSNDSNYFVDDGEDEDDISKKGRIIYFDEFRRSKMIAQPLPWDEERNWHKDYPRQWVDVDTIDMQAYIGSQWGFVVGKEAVADGVESLAAQRYQHEIRDYLTNLVWDKTPRLLNMGTRYFTCSPSDYISLVFKMWMIGSVARVMDPGCKMETALILEGPQGLGKSTALSILARKHEWFTDNEIDMHSKAGVETIIGAWIVEISELSSMKRADISTTKEFISRRYDKFRPPYGRETISVPRMCVFSGTVNPENDGYLKDPTGARRFWPIQCGDSIDLEALRIDLDQLWAEAHFHYQRGEPWYLTHADREMLHEFERVQMSRRERGPLEGRVLGWLGEQLSKTSNGVFEFTVAQIGAEAFGYSLKELSEGYRTRELGAVCGKLRLEKLGRARYKYYDPYDENKRPQAVHSVVYRITSDQLYEITESDIEVKGGIGGQVSDAGSGLRDDDEIPF